MAIVIQELCNGEDGDVVTIDNSSFVFDEFQTPSNTFFDYLRSVEGGCSVRLRPTYQAVFLPVSNPTGPFHYLSAYVRLEDATPASSSHLVFANGTTGPGLGTRAASVRLETNGKLSIIQGNSTVIATSVATMADNAWLRLDWTLAWGSAQPQKLEIYVGDNLHGTVPDETLSGAWNSTTQIGFFGFGLNGVGHLWYDRIIIRDDRLHEPIEPDTDLIEELLADLSGHTLDQGQLTWLTAPLDDSATTFEVDQGSQVFRGIAEVGEELVYVRSSDQVTNTVTLAPFGRGYQGTAKQAWPIETRVTFAPRFPRAHLRREINEVILGLYPALFGVGEFEIKNPSSTQVTYTLPSAAEDVLNIKATTTGPSGFERTLQMYGVNKTGGRVTVDIFEGIDPGTTLKVTYSKPLQPLKPGNSFTDTGLARSAWSCVKYGALHRLIGVQEAGTSAKESAEGAELARNRTPSPAALSRQFYAVFQQLLSEERTRLLDSLEIINNSEYI